MGAGVLSTGPVRPGSVHPGDLLRRRVSAAFRLRPPGCGSSVTPDPAAFRRAPAVHDALPHGHLLLHLALHRLGGGTGLRASGRLFIYAVASVARRSPGELPGVADPDLGPSDRHRSGLWRPAGHPRLAPGALRAGASKEAKRANRPGRWAPRPPDRCRAGRRDGRAGDGEARQLSRSRHWVSSTTTQRKPAASSTA